MDQSLQQLSENLLHMMRGALLMLFITMCINLYPRRKENSILGSLFWLLAIMPLLILASFGFMIDSLRNSEYFCTFKMLIDLCLIPLIGSFLLKILIPYHINIPKALLLIAPTIVFVFIHIITENKTILTLSFIYTALVAMVVLILIIFISIRYDRYLKNNFSNIDNMTVRWVRRIIYVFATWYLIWSMIIRLDSRWFDSAYYLFLIAIWILIYKYSIKHVTVFNTQELFESVPPEIISSPESEINTKLGLKLELYMTQEQPWLNPTITLQELASTVGTNRTYLSEYFNKILNTTFYDYLNSFRLKYACELLLSENNLSILRIGEQSGFNSLSTFRRAFEKQIGCSPAKYRSQNINI